jgi:hypothetical protein
MRRLNNKETWLLGRPTIPLHTHLYHGKSPLNNTQSYISQLLTPPTERPLQLRPPAIQIHPRRPSLPHRQPRPKSRSPRPTSNLPNLFRPHARRLPALRRRRARPLQSDQRRRAHRKLPLGASRLQIAIRRTQARERRAGPCRGSFRIARQEAACEPDAGEPLLGCCDESWRRGGEFESAV